MSAPGIFGPDRCAKLIRNGSYVGIRPLRLVAGPGHWAARARTNLGVQPPAHRPEARTPTAGLGDLNTHFHAIGDTQ